MRRHAPLALLLFAACPKDKDDSGDAPSALAQVDIPDSWESREASVVMRVTNSSTTTTEVRRALNDLFNDREDPVDAIDFLMRVPERDPVTGELLPIDTSLSTAELMAGSSLEQAYAFRQKIVDGDQIAFSREEAVDACGNEMIMAITSPHTLQHVFPSGPQDLPVWPTSCVDGVDCETASFGTWDVALGEMRFDGAIDMVVNIFPDTRVDPIEPGVWGHLSGFFLSTNNPGFQFAPLFANIRRDQVNLTGVWELDRNYVDPVGVREVFKFPHRSRRLDASDVFVFLEGYKTADEYWTASGLAAEAIRPFGFEQGTPIALDASAPAGGDVIAFAGPDETLLTQLGDVVAYQIGAAISCPSVRDPKYIRKGPVEFFLCPDTGIGECMAREDMEEAACIWQEEPVPSPIDLFPVSFTRYDVVNPSTPVAVPEGRVPSYVATPVPSGEVQVTLDVNPDSVLYLFDPERVVAVESQTGIAVQLPAAIPDSHCADTPVQRFDVGAAWATGTYTLTLDMTLDPDNTPGSGDELLEETGVGGTRYMMWMYYSSLTAWSSGE